MQETWRNNACTWKTSFSRLHFWFILISFQKLFPKIWVAKLRVRLICECDLYASVYGNRSSSQSDSFLAFATFWPIVFHFAQAKQKWKNYRDQDRLTFLAPLHQTPFWWITLLFATHASNSKVNLLTGYTLCDKCVGYLTSPAEPSTRRCRRLGLWFIVLIRED